MPKISIVIPVYNIENYISQCLNSLISQTFQDFEIICVNDGSKDNSLQILKDYAGKDGRIKVISQENSGSGSARNRGFREAQGKYIQFLDGDDYFEPQMLEKLYNLAEKHGAEIAVCSSRKVDDEGNITESRNPNSPINLDKTPFNKPFSYRDFPEDIFSLIGTMPWNKLYLREMLTKNHLEFPRLTGPDDLCFVYMSYVCAEKIAAIDDELINYRFNRAGSVQTYRANHASDIIRASIFVKEFLKLKGVFETVRIAYLRAFINSIRWEISLCNDIQYEKFLNELKVLMPEDWEIFKPALRKDYINLDYLYNIIGHKKVMLWGAGFFTQKLFENEVEKNPNILGIIDRNRASWGNKVGNYTIYPPEIIKEFEPEGILSMIVNNNETIYPELKKEIEEKYPKTTMLPNIFQ